MKKKIFKIGSEELRGKSREITRFDARIPLLLRDMADTMYEARGVGLAAPQIGILRRMVVIDVGEGLIELVNPVITARDGEDVGPEGCLSVPGRQGMVKRSAKVSVSARDAKGEAFTLEAEGLLARALQHELDHLDGVLYVDIMDYEIFEEEEEDEETSKARSKRRKS